MTTIPLNDRPHALYRFFDASGRLLYIGITASLPTRLGDHNDEKPWWSTVANITVVHYRDRESVLLAERAAIIEERPVHNSTHNRRRSPVPTARSSSREHIPAGCQAWTFTSHNGYTRTGPLWLTWEMPGDPISDNYYVDDISATDLWREWATRCGLNADDHQRFGPGTMRIYWYVEGAGIFETAPFQPRSPWIEEKHFLTQYTWPAVEGARVQWGRLPVVDKVWRHGPLPELHTHKGGFIQEATGWKPSPLQPYVNVRDLALMSGLPVPELIDAKAAV